MRALTSPGVSHQERDGQGCWKICLSVARNIFLWWQKLWWVHVSILVLASASCVTCAGEFLQRCSLINELAATCFSLFHNSMTGPPFSFAVITRSIYCTYFQRSKLISLCLAQIDFTSLEATARLQSRLNHWRSALIHFVYQVFPQPDTLKLVQDCRPVLYNCSTL